MLTDFIKFHSISIQTISAIDITPAHVHSNYDYYANTEICLIMTDWRSSGHSQRLGLVATETNPLTGGLAIQEIHPKSTLTLFLFMTSISVLGSFCNFELSTAVALLWFVQNFKMIQQLWRLSTNTRSFSWEFKRDFGFISYNANDPQTTHRLASSRGCIFSGNHLTCSWQIYIGHN